MNTSFICPHCQKEVELNEALTHKIKEEVLASVAKDNEAKLKEAITVAETKARIKFETEANIKLKDKDNENGELKERNKQLTDQLLDLNKSIRELKTRDEQRALEMQKQVSLEKEKAKQEALLKADEDHRMKDLENQKIINDLKKSLEEAKRKAEQGSMQTQGEVLELDAEAMLKAAFPNDEIEPVAKGINGADIRQIVKTPRGNISGTILWEFKRTKHWSDDWITKLKADVRSATANIGALITQVMPNGSNHAIEHYNAIWVGNYQSLIPLAALLRKNLIDVATQKFVSSNRTDKAQLLYDYITSHEFKQQLEALVESFVDMNNQVTKERLLFEKNWKQREGSIKRLFLSTAAMIGGIEGTGAKLPSIKGLDLLESENEPSEETTQPMLDI